jgi:hypothetical protein
VAGIPIRRRSLTEKDSPGAAAVELINAHAPSVDLQLKHFGSGGRHGEQVASKPKKAVAAH